MPTPPLSNSINHNRGSSNHNSGSNNNNKNVLEKKKASKIPEGLDKENTLFRPVFKAQKKHELEMAFPESLGPEVTIKGSDETGDEKGIEVKATVTYDFANMKLIIEDLQASVEALQASDKTKTATLEALQASDKKKTATLEALQASDKKKTATLKDYKEKFKKLKQTDAKHAETQRKTDRALVNLRREVATLNGEVIDLTQENADRLAEIDSLNTVIVNELELRSTSLVE